MQTHYSTKQRRIDIANISIFLILVFWHGYHLILATTLKTLTPVVLGFSLSLLLADFISGFVHWAADTWGTAQWPVVGPMLIGPFREHHADQKAITRHDFAETNGNNCLVSLPVLISMFFIPHLNQAWPSFFDSTLLGLVIWIFLTNQFHKWSHEDQVSPVILFLQKTKLILPADHHSHHHGYPFTKNYCITNGWMNPILNKIQFFRRLEKFVTFTTGAIPREEDLNQAAPTLETRQIS